MPDEKATSKPSTPPPAAPNQGAPNDLKAKSYRGIGLDQAYREGRASYREVTPSMAPLPTPPLRGAPANAAPAKTAPASTPPKSSKST